MAVELDGKILMKRDKLIIIVVIEYQKLSDASHENTLKVGREKREKDHKQRT